MELRIDHPWWRVDINHFVHVSSDIFEPDVHLTEEFGGHNSMFFFGEFQAKSAYHTTYRTSVGKNPALCERPWHTPDEEASVLRVGNLPIRVARCLVVAAIHLTLSIENAPPVLGLELSLRVHVDLHLD